MNLVGLWPFVGGLPWWYEGPHWTPAFARVTFLSEGDGFTASRQSGSIDMPRSQTEK